MPTQRSAYFSFRPLQYILLYSFVIICALTGTAHRLLADDYISISGTVSLPAGQTASADMVIMILYNSNYGSGGKPVTILQGTSSATYTISVAKNPNAVWRIRYSYTGDGYMHDGLYTTLLSGDQNHSNINMIVLAANTIRGTVSLPAPAPNGGLKITVHADDTNDNGYAESITIAENTSSNTLVNRPFDT